MRMRRGRFFSERVLAALVFGCGAAFADAHRSVAGHRSGGHRRSRAAVRERELGDLYERVADLSASVQSVVATVQSSIKKGVTDLVAAARSEKNGGPTTFIADNTVSVSDWQVVSGQLKRIEQEQLHQEQELAAMGQEQRILAAELTGFGNRYASTRFAERQRERFLHRFPSPRRSSHQNGAGKRGLKVAARPSSSGNTAERVKKGVERERVRVGTKSVQEVGVEALQNRAQQAERQSTKGIVAMTFPRARKTNESETHAEQKSGASKNSQEASELQRNKQNLVRNLVQHRAQAAAPPATSPTSTAKKVDSKQVKKPTHNHDSQRQSPKLEEDASSTMSGTDDDDGDDDDDDESDDEEDDAAPAPLPKPMPKKNGKTHSEEHQQTSASTPTPGAGPAGSETKISNAPHVAQPQSWPVITHKAETRPRISNPTEHKKHKLSWTEIIADRSRTRRNKHYRKGGQRGRAGSRTGGGGESVTAEEMNSWLNHWQQSNSKSAKEVRTEFAHLNQPSLANALTNLR
eukprot:g18852.t1